MSTTPRVRVLIADDNRAYRRGVRVRLEQAPGIRVVGEVSNGVDAAMAARSEHADVVLMDLSMPGGSGLDATRALAGPGVGDPVAVVVVTNHASDEHVFEAIDSGAVGYLLKNHDTAQLYKAVEAAARGEGLVSSRVTSALTRELARRRAQSTALNAPSPTLLTTAELAVSAKLARGITSNEALSDALHLSINTVRSQLRSALKKTGLDDRTQLAVWAVRQGLDRSEG